MRILALLLLAALVPGASAATVVVPSQVAGEAVAFRIDGAHDGNATFTMGATSVGPFSLPAGGFHVFEDRAPGIHAWSIKIENATHIEYHNGSVLVQAPHADPGTSAALAGIASSLAALTALLDPANHTDNGTVWSQFHDTWNATVWGSLQSDLAWLRQNMGTSATTVEPASSRVGPVAATSATLSAAFAVAALALLAWSQWQARRHYREQMVLMLAMAAQMKVGPDSPEFQRALAAFDD